MKGGGDEVPVVREWVVYFEGFKRFKYTPRVNLESITMPEMKTPWEVLRYGEGVWDHAQPTGEQPRGLPRIGSESDVLLAGYQGVGGRTYRQSIVHI